MNVRSRVGEHELSAFAFRTLRPGGQESSPRVLTSGVFMNTPVKLITGERMCSVSCRELASRLALPHLLLATHFLELDTSDGRQDASEGSAGLDSLQLLRITQEHDLRLRLVSGFEYAGKLASADHASLIND